MGWNRNGKFTWDKIKDMDEEHLCNTISCGSSYVSEKRKQQCREELMKRWDQDVNQISKKRKQKPETNNSINVSNVVKQFIDKR